MLQGHTASPAAFEDLSILGPGCFRGSSLKGAPMSGKHLTTSVAACTSACACGCCLHSNRVHYPLCITAACSCTEQTLIGFSADPLALGAGSYLKPRWPPAVRESAAQPQTGKDSIGKPQLCRRAVLQGPSGIKVSMMKTWVTSTGCCLTAACRDKGVHLEHSNNEQLEVRGG